MIMMPKVCGLMGRAFSGIAGRPGDARWFRASSWLPVAGSLPGLRRHPQGRGEPVLAGHGVVIRPIRLPPVLNHMAPSGPATIEPGR
jgi:hypothetical protein